MKLDRSDFDKSACGCSESADDGNAEEFEGSAEVG